MFTFISFRCPFVFGATVQSAARALVMGWGAIVLFALPILAQELPGDSSRAEPDGPYVFRQLAGGFVAKRVVKVGENLELREETAPAEKGEVSETFPSHAEARTIRVRATNRVPVAVHAQPEKVFVVSDIEGNFGALTDLLRAAGVVDEKLRWAFGKGHFVFLGDLLDRGSQVTECLWLLYDLEAQAEAAGGVSHFVLGNHEVMNFVGDFRYVRKKYAENCTILRETLGSIYSKRSVLGEWLRTRNVMLRLGNDLYVHGGIAPAAAEAKVGLQDANDRLRAALLEDEWVPSRHPTMIHTVGYPDGFLWYRGYFQAPLVTEAAMDGVLTAFGVERVVVGHTIVPEVDFRLGGRVLAVDVHHAKGIRQGALREGQQWFRLSDQGTRTPLAAPPVPAGAR